MQHDPTDRPEVDVSVILPVYNEAGHLTVELERIRESLDASALSYEIIVIDDGSSDGSGEVLRAIPYITLIQFGTNRGSGSARRIGTAAARGRVVVWTDVDMTYPNDRIPDLVAELAGHDHVVGARTTEEGTHKLLRTPAKWVIRKLAEFLSGTSIPDLNSGFRAFRRDVAKQYLHLLPAGFSCVTTITLSFLTNGYSVKYVPIPYAARAGESKFHWWKDTRRYVTQVVRMILMFNPLRVLGPIGMTLLLVGMGKLVYDVATDWFVVAINTIVVLMAALLTLLVAMLSDLVVQLTRPKAEVMPATTYVATPTRESASG